MAAKKSQPVSKTSTSRRELLKKAAYVAPAVLTLAATPAFAAKGSHDRREKKEKKWKKKD